MTGHATHPPLRDKPEATPAAKPQETITSSSWPLGYAFPPAWTAGQPANDGPIRPTQCFSSVAAAAVTPSSPAPTRTGRGDRVMTAPTTALAAINAPATLGSPRSETAFVTGTTVGCWWLNPHSRPVLSMKYTRRGWKTATVVAPKTSAPAQPASQR